MHTKLHLVFWLYLTKTQRRSVLSSSGDRYVTPGTNNEYSVAQLCAMEIEVITQGKKKQKA